MTEIEFKFEIPQQRLSALQKDFARAKTQRTHLQARYFDTADGTLSKNNAALRLRKEGRRWVQTAKALGDGPLHRLEHNVDLGVSRAGVPVQVDARRHAGTPVGEMLERLLGDAPLVETFATDIWRTTRQARLGRSIVELALDDGRVVAPASNGKPERASVVRELELELVSGSVADLVALAQRWSQRRGLWFSTVSKAERGERLRQAQQQQGNVQDEARAVKAAPARFAGAQEDKKGGLLVGPAELQRAVVAACLAQILPNATEIAAGNEAPELVHQLRVGIRRLRSALRELEDVAPGRFDTAGWEPVLVEAFRMLGAQRDRDVLAATLQPRLQAAGAPLADLPKLDNTQQEAPSPGELVRSSSFQKLLVALIGFAAPDGAPAAVTREEADAVRVVVAERLSKLHRQLRKAGKRFEALPTEKQHLARKRLKRLRYLAEFVAPLFDKEKARRYIEQLLPAQEALGDYNDDVVGIETYRQASEQDPRAWFAVGWLIAQQPSFANACARALREVGKARKFWK